MARHDLEASKNLSKEERVDAFGMRMNIAIKRAGGVTVMSEKAGVSTSVLRKWRAGQSEPTLSSLVSMARAADLSVEWLATGEGTPEAGPTAGERRIDLEVLEDVIIRTRRISEHKGMVLKPEAEARIIRLVYEFSMRQGQPMDDSSLNNIIELTSL